MPHQPLAEVTRNGLVESVHHGSAVVLGADGRVEHAFGDVHTAVYPRSSNKPMQAVAMTELGLHLPQPLLALAAASHSGEAMHLAGVQTILAAAGLTEAALGCVVGAPLGATAARERWRSGAEPTRLTMNCSGKHAAMLATCVGCGWDHTGYLSVDHPLTTHITHTITRLAGEAPAAIGVDGCGAPAHTLSLVALARAYAAIVRAGSGSAERRVADAMRAHPELVGGTDRDVTVLMRALPGLLAKDGAEGVYAAALPDGRAVALKIADGSERARVPVLLRLLELAGVDTDAVAGWRRPATLGGGAPVGEVRCVL